VPVRPETNAQDPGQTDGLCLRRFRRHDASPDSAFLSNLQELKSFCELEHYPSWLSLHSMDGFLNEFLHARCVPCIQKRQYSFVTCDSAYSASTKAVYSARTVVPLC